MLTYEVPLPLEMCIVFLLESIKNSFPVLCHITSDSHLLFAYCAFPLIYPYVSVQFSYSVVSDSATPWTAACQSCPSPTPGACSNSCPSSQWCHPTISSSVIIFSSCLQSFPAPGSFPMFKLFLLGDQSIGASTSASFLPMNIQDQFPLGLTGWLSLQSRWLSRVFFNITVQKHKFFSAQPSLWSNSDICTWLLEKP